MKSEASIDLHRIVLYEKIGVKVPSTEQEEEKIGRALNRCLLYGDRLEDSVRVSHEGQP